MAELTVETQTMINALIALRDSPDTREIVRRAVEDELIDWRDRGMAEMGRNNGLTVKYRDGQPGPIRFGFETGFVVALDAIIEQLEAYKESKEK